jgi:hypothetical protein
VRMRVGLGHSSTHSVSLTSSVSLSLQHATCKVFRVRRQHRHVRRHVCVRDVFVLVAAALSGRAPATSHGAGSGHRAGRQRAPLHGRRDVLRHGRLHAARRPRLPVLEHAGICDADHQPVCRRRGRERPKEPQRPHCGAVGDHARRFGHRRHQRRVPRKLRGEWWRGLVCSVAAEPGVLALLLLLLFSLLSAACCLDLALTGHVRRAQVSRPDGAQSRSANRGTAEPGADRVRRAPPPARLGARESELLRMRRRRRRLPALVLPPAAGLLLRGLRGLLVLLLVLLHAVESQQDRLVRLCCRARAATTRAGRRRR